MSRSRPSTAATPSKFRTRPSVVIAVVMGSILAPETGHPLAGFSTFFAEPTTAVGLALGVVRRGGGQRTQRPRKAGQCRGGRAGAAGYKSHARHGQDRRRRAAASRRRRLTISR